MVSEKLDVAFSNSFTGNFSVFNEFGQHVFSNQIGQKDFTLDVSDLESGIYFMMTEKMNGQNSVARFTVLH